MVSMRLFGVSRWSCFILGCVFSLQSSIGLAQADLDTDGDGVSDAMEAVYATSSSDELSTPVICYSFDKDTAGWTGVDWGDGEPTLSWTNRGYPRGGALVATMPDGDKYAECYVQDGTQVEDRNVLASSVYRAWVYVPTDADPNGAQVQLWAKSSADDWSVHYDNGFYSLSPGEWTLVSWKMAELGDQVLSDLDEWGMKLMWLDRGEWNGPILIDTVHMVPDGTPLPSADEGYEEEGASAPPQEEPTPVASQKKPVTTRARKLELDAPEVKSVEALDDEVGKYEKLELDVALKNVEKLNPYDPVAVNLEGLFLSPSGEKWRVPGFYMKDPAGEGDEGQWKIRFAPDEVGVWKYMVRVSNPFGADKSSAGSFECVGSDQHGWIRPSEKDPHYLAHDDGTPFYGVGYCRCWDGDDEGIFSDAAANGINMLHWWMAPWDTMLTVAAVEPGRESSSYDTYEQARAAELDRVIQHAEKHGVKLIFTIWPHDAIRDFNHHKWRVNGSWAKAIGKKYSEPEWYINAFSELDDPPKNQKFFYDREYLKHQANLYRYIIARWGYSEAIGTWALASEMFGTFADSRNCIAYQDRKWKNRKSDLFGRNPFSHMDWNQCAGEDYTVYWLKFINNYFKKNDPFGHPTTASYATDEYWEDGFPVVDMPQIHSYADLYSWITPPVTLAKYHRYLWDKYDKPSFIGETGVVDWKKYEPDYVRVTAWPALCSGAAITPMMWTTPQFSDFGDPKMGPWTDEMSIAMQGVAHFVEGIDFPQLGLTPASVSTREPDEPLERIIETFESGVNGWNKHGDGVTSIGLSRDNAAEGASCLKMNVDIPTWDKMQSPSPGIEKYGFKADWSEYWPDGTLKLDLFIPEFYHPKHNPDGFLLGINKDPRCVVEVHCQAPGEDRKWYSTTKEYGTEGGGWKKLTVGMLYNLELRLDAIPTEAEAANVKGIKLMFGDAGILKGPVYIDNIRVGRYAYNTYGMLSEDQEFAFAWIQDRRWIDDLSVGAEFRMDGLRPGSTYNLEWWDTLEGPFASSNIDTEDGVLRAIVPDFTKDIAVKVRRVGDIGETVHDVAISAVETPEWIVRSPTQRIEVVVCNRGTASGTFNLSVSDATVGAHLGLKPVEVDAGTTKIVLFDWDAMGIQEGIHDLKANARSVRGERNREDNEKSVAVRVHESQPPWDSCDRLRRWGVWPARNNDANDLSVTEDRASEGSASIRLQYGAPEHGQACMGFDNVNENWADKQHIALDLYNAGSAKHVQIQLRTGNGRVWYYSQARELNPGWNKGIAVGLQTPMWKSDGGAYGKSADVVPLDLDQIEQVYIKLMGYEKAGVAYIDNIRLEE